MSYSLENFCDEARAALSARDDAASRDAVRQQLEKLLADEAFLAEYVGPDGKRGVTKIFEDPDTHFCVLAYNMTDPRTSPPHDHGGSWAVYGQASGYTDMTIWSADDDGVKPVREFRLEAGQAGLFDIGEIHSIKYTEGAKFVRVTGVDMSSETRRVFDAETGAVKEIEHVGTGNA